LCPCRAVFLGPESVLAVTVKANESGFVSVECALIDTFALSASDALGLQVSGFEFRHS
jgi:hypothetical protein